MNEIDTITIDVPLLMRLLEFAKEDAKSDVELHKLVDNMLKLQQKNSVLNIDHYNSLVNIESVASVGRVNINKIKI